MCFGIASLYLLVNRKMKKSETFPGVSYENLSRAHIEHFPFLLLNKILSSSLTVDKTNVFPSFQESWLSTISAGCLESSVQLSFGRTAYQPETFFLAIFGLPLQ